jgi:pyridoxamine 5'-phosphate oxidase
MLFAPWRSPLSRALDLNRTHPESRYFQLATVRSDGKPANRTVVFRGFLENSDRLQISTDSRSEKIAQIKAYHWGEACWYFTQTREQFRLLGQLTVVGVDCTDESLQQSRQVVWQGLSDAARSQFTWSNPAQPRTDFSSSIPSPSDPLANFCLLLLDPERVDHLELQEQPHNRTQYYRDRDRTWKVVSVNP